MRILSISRRPTFPLIVGGAEISQHELLTFLATQGNEVLSAGEVWRGCHDAADGGLTSSVSSKRHQMLGQSYENTHMEVVLGQRYKSVHNCGADFFSWAVSLVDSFTPDIVFTQLDGYVDVARAVEDQAPIVHFIRDLIHPSNFIPYISSWLKPDPALTVANSHFASEQILDRFGVEAIVCYPFVKKAEGKSTVKDIHVKTVALLNASSAKGGRIILEVAKRCRHIKFMVGSGWNVPPPADFEGLPNVEIVRSMVSPDVFFSQADLVVVPSQVPECFCRVAIEAQVRGLPVIASHIGAIPEVVADSAVLVKDVASIDAWSTAIENTLSDPTWMRKLRAAARANAARFSDVAALVEFEHILGHLVCSWRRVWVQ